MKSTKEIIINHKETRIVKWRRWTRITNDRREKSRLNLTFQDVQAYLIVVLTEKDFAADVSSLCFFHVTRECPISEDYELVDINQGKYVSSRVLVICKHFENMILLKTMLPSQTSCIGKQAAKLVNSTLNLT